MAFLLSLLYWKNEQKIRILLHRFLFFPFSLMYLNILDLQCLACVTVSELILIRCPGLFSLASVNTVNWAAGAQPTTATTLQLRVFALFLFAPTISRPRLKQCCLIAHDTWPGVVTAGAVKEASYILRTLFANLFQSIAFFSIVVQATRGFIC